jgi:hypothetical protein
LTFTPHKMARVQDEVVARVSPATGVPGTASTAVSAPGTGRGGRGGGAPGRGTASPGPDPLYAAMTSKEMRDPRGFIIPSDQPDFGAATEFVNALIKTGITVLRATAPFSVGGKGYPANSYVVKTAQAFRPHVMDLFEPQDHPDDIPYPGGPPTAHDSTGYTLAFQMGVVFDRVLDGFDRPFVKLTEFNRAGGSRADQSGGDRLLLHAPGQTAPWPSIGCSPPTKRCLLDRPHGLRHLFVQPDRRPCR